MKLKIKGTIIPDDYADFYEAFGIDYTSPKSVALPEDGKEDVLVEINSYGGDVYSGSEIYTILKNYPGKVTTIVTGIAASMASVVAMAGDMVKMAPTSQMMIHNVSSYAEGDKEIMSHEAEVLNGYDKTLANAYRLKTGMSQEELLELMNKETWLTPQDAIKYGFADEILFDEKEAPLLVAAAPQAVFFSKETIERLSQQKGQNMGGKLKTKAQEEKMLKDKEEPEEEEEKEEEEEEREEKPEEETTEGSQEKEEEEESPEEEEEEEEEEKKAMEMKTIKNSAPMSPEPQPKAEYLEARVMPRFKDESNGKKLVTIVGGEKPMKNYRDVFLNYIRGAKMDDEDMRVLQENNSAFSNAAFTHDTTNTAVVIPQTTQEKIWARATDGYSFLADVKRLNVKGELRMIRHKAIESGDATWYVESTPTADEKNTFDDLVLKGNELSKAVTVSWKLRAMAMDDFEDFLVNEIGERISAVLGQGVISGTGINQATGVVTALTKDKKQVVNVAKTGVLDYSDLLNAISKVHSSYKAGACIYANSAVIWTKLANVLDQQKRPFFIADRSEGGVGNVLGFPVKEDAALKDDQILIGNAGQGYILNVNEEMSITTEDHAKARTTDYVGYMVVDGNVLDLQAFALLSLTQASA